MSTGGLFVRVVQALARGALRSIAAALRRFGSGLKLFNWVRSKWGPLSSQEASQLYQLGKQYVAAGQIQTALGDGGVIEPGNVPYNPGLTDQIGPGNIVQYHTTIQLYDPTSGRELYKTIFVDSGVYLTTQDILNEAADSAIAMATNPAISTDPILLGSGVQVLTFSIVGIQRGA